MAASILLLLFGVFCCSTSVIFIKNASTDPVLLAAYRQILAAAFLAPLMYRALHQRGITLTRAQLWRTLPPALLLGLHFITWIIGARYTPAANATLIVNMTPIAMPFFLYFLTREVVTRGEVTGTVLALLGVLLLGVADFNTSMTYFVGDVICFASMLCYTVYLVYGRRNRDFPSLYAYVVPVYFFGGVFCLLIALVAMPFGWVRFEMASFTTAEVINVVGLALVPGVLGHSLLNQAMRHLRGQLVAIFNLSQFIFAAVLAYFLLAEIPVPAFYVAALLLVVGAAIVIKTHRDSQQPPAPTRPAPPPPPERPGGNRER